jgi:hypothetical protein
MTADANRIARLGIRPEKTLGQDVVHHDAIVSGIERVSTDE